MSPEGLGMLLTTLAGLSTTFGSLAVFCLDKCKPLRFAMCMSFSAGVMLYISFVELLPTARKHFEHAYNFSTAETISSAASQKAYTKATLSFFLGWITTSFLDKLFTFSMRWHTNLRISRLKHKIIEKKKKIQKPKNHNSDAFLKYPSIEELSVEETSSAELDASGSVEENSCKLNATASSSLVLCSEEKPSRRINPKTTSVDAAASPAAALFSLDIDNNIKIQNQNAQKPTCSTTLLSSFSKQLQCYPKRPKLLDFTNIPTEEASSTLLSSETTAKNQLYSNSAAGKPTPSCNNLNHKSSALWINKVQTTPSPSVSSNLDQEEQHLMQVSTNSSNECADRNATTSTTTAPTINSKQYLLLKSAVRILLLQSDATESENEEVIYANRRFKRKQHQFIRLGLFTACALAIHNFPEGIATYTSALENPRFGIGIAVAIGLHNIPEGFAISVPIYYGSGSKLKGFTYSLISGFAEPVGAFLAYLIMKGKTNHETFGWVVGVVAGIMANIALKELYPEALKFDPTDKIVSMCFVVSMALIAVTLVLLELLNSTT